jgi:protein-S-isoprenylcysteine O-methyltransferase Ste14
MRLAGSGFIMAMVSNLAICACWLVYIVYWIGSARRLKPVVERQSWLSIIAHRGPIMLGALMLLFPILSHSPGLALTPHTDFAVAIGAVVCVLGLSVAIWSRQTLAGNWSATVTFKQGHELVQAGPYRFVRHPIYTGILLMILGSVIAVGRLHSWLGFLIVCAGFWIKLKQEESLMLRHFPDEYPAYRARVKSLVPFLI